MPVRSIARAIEIGRRTSSRHLVPTNDRIHDRLVPAQGADEQPGDVAIEAGVERDPCPAAAQDLEGVFRAVDRLDTLGTIELGQAATE